MAAASNNFDNQLATEQFPGLNHAFYNAGPADYFWWRLQSLLIMAARSQEVERMLASGIEFGDLRLARAGNAASSNSNQHHSAYITTECETLFHHSSEALIRLFLAHRGQPACPRLDLARLRQAWRFKQQVEALANSTLDEDMKKDVAHVFVGETIDDPDNDFSDIPDENVANVHRLLTHYCRRLLDEASLYNAMKHGFAVKGGNSSFSLSDAQEHPIASADGPSIEYLEVRDDAHKLSWWYETTTWIKPDRVMLVTAVAIRLIESLWAVARARYVGDPSGSIHVFSQSDVDRVLSVPTATATSMRRKLHYN